MKIFKLLSILTLTSCGFHGTDGINGTTGKDGYNTLITSIPSASCGNGGATILAGLDLNRNNVLELEEATSSQDICNGANEIDGTSSAWTPVGLVDPCGDTPNKYDEVFLRLQNGQLLASVSDNANGANTRFSILTPGNYATTDGTNCRFSVDANNNIYNERIQ